MGTLSRRAVSIGVVAMWIGGVIAAHIAGGRDPVRTAECAALMLAAAGLSAGSFQRTIGTHRVMPPSFVATFCALLLLGPDAALLVAAIAAATPPWKSAERGYPLARMLGSAALAMIAIRVAGLVYGALGGTVAIFEWPWEAVPIGAAALGYHLVESGLSDVAVP